MHDFISALIQLDPLAIAQTGGYIGLALIIFAESGILIGIIFPGDSLLFASGMLAANGFFATELLMPLVVGAAILGDSVGYWFGARVGAPLFTREDSRFFKQKHVDRTKIFYETYGGRAVVLARFVPVVRTLAPVLAGVGAMRYRTFLSYNIIGGALWGIGMTSLGYTLGTIVPESQHYILPISLGIIAISFLPILINSIRGRRAV